MIGSMHPYTLQPTPYTLKPTLTLQPTSGLQSDSPAIPLPL